MGKYLKTFRVYPAGTIVLVKKYSFWKRLLKFLSGKKRSYNGLHVMLNDSKIKISKVDLLVNDYVLLVPKKPYTKEEKKLLHVFSKSCETAEDWLIAANAIRPNSIDEDIYNIDNINYTDYYKLYLDSEPFQNVFK